jgi:hypothetical protein
VADPFFGFFPEQARSAPARSPGQDATPRRLSFRGVVCRARRDLNVHHRNGHLSDQRIANLVTLCSRHHRDVEGGRLVL